VFVRQLPPSTFQISPVPNGLLHPASFCGTFGPIGFRNCCRFSSPDIANDLQSQFIFLIFITPHTRDGTLSVATGPLFGILSPVPAFFFPVYCKFSVFVSLPFLAGWLALFLRPFFFVCFLSLTEPRRLLHNPFKICWSNGEWPFHRFASIFPGPPSTLTHPVHAVFGPFVMFLGRRPVTHLRVGIFVRFCFFFWSVPWVLPFFGTPVGRVSLSPFPTVSRTGPASTGRPRRRLLTPL